MSDFVQPAGPEDWKKTQQNSNSVKLVTFTFSDHYLSCSIDEKWIYHNIFRNDLNFLFSSKFCLKDSFTKNEVFLSFTTTQTNCH